MSLLVYVYVVYVAPAVLLTSVLLTLPRHIIQQYMVYEHVKSHVQMCLCLCESPHGPTE
jgi:hypothetical protein